MPVNSKHKYKTCLNVGTEQHTGILFVL